MTQLPPQSYPPGLWHNAYNACLTFEAVSLNAPPPISGPSSLVCARLLGYMILEAPTDTGRGNISNEVLSCTNNMDRQKLAKFYIDHFLRCFRAAKGRTPAPSNHPSRPSFDDVQEILKYLLEEAPQNHATAKDKALIRDGYRCVVTGTYDINSYRNVEAVRTAVKNNPDAPVRATRCAHIFPESINQNISGDMEGGNKHEYAASLWAVMERFGQVLVPEELNGSQIHRLENVMTMEIGIHDLFDSLTIWFEATATPNQYRLQGTEDVPLRHLPPLVTFSSTRADLPLPSPLYLRMHAACARVAHLSGAGEYIESVLRDMEKTKVLSKDGASAEAVRYALLTASTQPLRT